MAIPWDKIRTEWLKGGITQAELAKKYNVSEKSIYNLSSKEHWKDQKGKIREEVEKSVNARISCARANRLEKLITAQEDTLDALVDLAARVKKNPLLLFDEKGSLKNAESLTKALQVGAQTQRDLYGMKNIDQKFAAKKWKEEQKLQRELKAMKDQNGITGQMTVIIHEPAEEPAAEGDAEHE